MKVVLISMPGVVPIIIHEMAIHRLEMMNHFEDLQAFMNKNHEHQASRRTGGGFP